MALLYHGDIATLILEHAASHTTSLIDGIKLLHVLPPAEQPRTRAIILARGFVRPALAVTLGYARLLQDFPAWLVLDAREPILYALASIGDVETLASFYAESTRAITHDPLTIDAVYDSVLLQAVYASNHVPVFEWFHCQKWNLNNRPWLTKEGTCCPVPVLEWALDKRYVNLDGFDQELWAASKAGEMPVLEWFQGQQHRRGRPCASEAPRVIPDAATAGVQLGVLDWWWTSVALCTFPTPIDFAIFSRVALSTGSLDMVLWWWTKFETHRTPEHRFGSRGAANMAISSCSLPVIQWLWAVAARPDAADLLDDWTDAKLATLPTGRFVGSLALVQWWVETQLPSGHAALPWTRYNTYTCASIGAADVLDYILARPDQSATEWGVELVSTALRFRQQRVLEWYVSHRAQLPEQAHPLVFFDQPVKSIHGLGVLAWWETHVGLVDASFVCLGAGIARFGGRAWLRWWIEQLRKPARRHLVAHALARALVAAESAWVLETLARTTSDEFGLVEDLIKGHKCVRTGRTVEVVHWWYRVLDGHKSTYQWRAHRYGAHDVCGGCWRLDQAMGIETKRF